jgi:three-Cys-motif partner protein
MAVPEAYRGREQAYVKHTLLARYLERFGHKVGSAWSVINYVDCFAGPWQSSQSDYSDTSFGIAVQQLRKARRNLGLMPNSRSLTLRFCFVEADADSFQKLAAFSRANNALGCEIIPLQGQFHENLGRIKEFLATGGGTAFRFLLVDPKGWTGFALNRIAPLVNARSAEVLINLMTSFIRRFVTLEEQRSKFEELFGDAAVADEAAELEGKDRERFLVRRYAELLKHKAQFKFVSAAAVLRAAEDDVHYYLVFGTNSPHGIVVFKEAERVAFETGESARDEAKSRKRTDKSGQSELDIFGAGLVPPSPYATELRKRYLEEAKVRLRDNLPPGGSMPYDDLLGLILETPLVWEDDLERWLLEARSAGQIEIPTLVGQKRLKVDGGYTIKCLP